MADTNPYEVLDVSSPPEESSWGTQTDLEETLNGSSIWIGPRNEFSGRFHVRTAVLFILGLLGAGAILWFFLMETVEELTTALTVLLLFLFGGLLAGLRLEPLPRVAGRDLRTLAHARGGRIVDLTFEPRLPATPLERIDTADDVGVLWVESGALCFEGDRCRMRIDRRDVRRVGRKWVTGSIVLGHGRDVLVQLDHALAGRRSFHFGPRDLVDGFRTRRIGRRVRWLVEQWHVGASDS